MDVDFVVQEKGAGREAEGKGGEGLGGATARV